MKKITTEQLAALRENDNGDFVLVNVLGREQFEEHHIPGSVNAPLASDAFVSQVTSQVEGDKSKKIVVYCASASCNASEKAADRLEQAGFTNVHRYEEGVDGWLTTGHQLEVGAV